MNGRIREWLTRFIMIVDGRKMNEEVKMKGNETVKNANLIVTNQGKGKSRRREMEREEWEENRGKHKERKRKQ